MAGYTIRIEGDDVAPGRIPSIVLVDLISVLHHGAEGAVRLRLEGRSTAEGAAQRWLERASTFDLISVLKDEAAFRVEAPTLREALPDRFEQTVLFPELDPDRTALAFLAEAMEDAIAGREDSDAYDDGLLKRFAPLQRLFRRGLTSLQLQNARPDRPALRIDGEGMRQIQRLQHRIPDPRRVRMAGWVDQIRYSDRAFKLILDSGNAVRGVLVRGSADELRGYFGKAALVSGLAHFRPSGDLHRIEAEHVATASEADLELWAELPEPTARELNPRALRRSQGACSGLNAVFGKWPGEESDAELLAALRDLRE